MKCRPDRATCVALLVCLVLGVVYANGVSMEKSMGWDEAMHVQWPSARIGLAFADSDPSGGFEAIHDCQQYPFVYPTVLAIVQGLFGMTEVVARTFGRVLWALGAFGLFALVHEVLRHRPDGAEVPRAAAVAPWIAMGLALTSPMAISFSGMLFLEVPWMVLGVFTVLAWLRRRRLGGAHRDVLAGVLVAAAFFTKFNYGVLLGFALFVDLVLEVALARENRRAAVLGALRVGAPIVLSMAWWFGLPLPEGAATAASHREAFLGFLSENTGMGRTPAGPRLVFASCSLVRSPVILALVLVGLVGSLRLLRTSGGRTLWLVFLTVTLPIATHNFHLDRFQLPPSVFLWTLAGLGWSTLLPADRAKRALAGVGLLLFVVVGWFSASPGWWVLQATGIANPEFEVDQRAALARMGAVAPGRFLDTNGLERSEHDALVAVMREDLRPGERLGWIGMNTIFPPASPLFALQGEGHEAGRQLRDPSIGLAADQAEDETSPSFAGSFLTLGDQLDKDWHDDRLVAWASQFDVLYGTYPVDLNREGNREVLHKLRERLVELGWTMEIAGEFTHVKGPGVEFPAALLALRKR